MFIPEIFETRDKSYYADRLTELTGKLRSCWSQFSLDELRHAYRRALRTALALHAQKGGDYAETHYQKN